MIDDTIFQNRAVSGDYSGIGNLEILEFFRADNLLRIRRCLGFRFYNMGRNFDLFLFFVAGIGSSVTDTCGIA